MIRYVMSILKNKSEFNDLLQIVLTSQENQEIFPFLSQESIIDFSIVEIVIPAILFLAVKHPIAELPDVDAEQLLNDHLES